MSSAPAEIGCGVVGLARSRYEEDAFHKPHSSVWGSWFDISTKRWGYSCCRSTGYKSRHCSVGGASLENASGDKMCDLECEADMLQHARILILTWIRNTLRDWSNALDVADHRLQNDPVLGQVPRLQEAKVKLRPLVVSLKGSSSDALDHDLLSTLRQIVEAASQHNYESAKQAYIDYTIGKSKWHDGFAKRMPPMGKVAGRISDHKFVANRTLADPDTVAYLQVMKRLVTIAQLLHAG